MRGRKILRRAKTDYTRHIGLGQPANCLVGERQNAPAVTQKDVALPGQPKMARVSVDQAAAKGVFETFELETDCRLAQVKPLARTGEIASIGGRNERPKQIMVEARGHMLSLYNAMITVKTI